ncbi:hypothetical protein [Thauera aromatica]|uniref:hypothetical protein n=1 Tax=Thauera aromatica TaxID=59405 RepID=UPI001FFDC179|nr:hypothetical protein [Thauera aromatica]MCK2097247.1 hypothetical protein [Thauera aromatica]
MRRSAATLPPWLQRGIDRAERERKAAVIARPMRNLMDLLAQGEVHEIDSVPVMRMPEVDAQFAERAEWCAIAPAIRGWIDCWERIAPDLRLYRMAVLAERLEADKPITPRLVEQARAEFDATVARIAEIPPGRITSAIRTTEIAWEMEKLQMEGAA